MRKSNRTLLDAVIETFQHQSRDLSSVSLEEAKQVTLDILKTRQIRQQPTNRMSMPHVLDRFVDPPRRTPCQPMHIVCACSSAHE